MVEEDVDGGQSFNIMPFEKICYSLNEKRYSFNRKLMGYMWPISSIYKQKGHKPIICHKIDLVCTPIFTY